MQWYMEQSRMVSTSAPLIPKKFFTGPTLTILMIVMTSVDAKKAEKLVKHILQKFPMQANTNALEGIAPAQRQLVDNGRQVHFLQRQCTLFLKKLVKFWQDFFSLHVSNWWFQAGVRQNTVPNSPKEMKEGDKLTERECNLVIEDHPKEGYIYFRPSYTKGNFVQDFLKENVNINEKVYILSMGDDTIDEPMFERMNELGMHSVVVSSQNKRTMATKKLKNPEDVLNFLQELANSKPKE